MSDRLSKAELGNIESLLRPQSGASPAELQEGLVRLAHDGTDEALRMMVRAGPALPRALRGFYECALDECCFFNIGPKLEHICDQLDALGTPPEAEGEADSLEHELQSLEDRLLCRGIVADCSPSWNSAQQVSALRIFLALLGAEHFRGAGTMHVELGPSPCDDCLMDAGYAAHEGGCDRCPMLAPL